MQEGTLEAVLAALRARRGEYVSGEELADLLGVSRTAVWKHVARLRAAGYPIDAGPRLGYRLAGLPDSVTAPELLDGLATRRLGRMIEFRASVTSTNEVAKRLAREGAPEGLLVVAEEQIGGKGRLGRTWLSPPGVGVWMSLVLRPPLPPYEAPRLTLVAAVAVARAMRDLTGVAAGIKWPNDIVVADRKVCGILTELEAEWDRVAFAVLGIGINANTPPQQFPADLQATATSLLAASGQPVRRAALIQAILAGLEEGYDLMLAGRFDAVLVRWRELSATLGRRVRVLPVAPGQPAVAGVAEAVDPEGALLIRLGTGELVRVLAGEVSLRPE